MVLFSRGHLGPQAWPPRVSRSRWHIRGLLIRFWELCPHVRGGDMVGRTSSCSRCSDPGCGCAVTHSSGSVRAVRFVVYWSESDLNVGEMGNGVKTVEDQFKWGLSF